MGHLRDFFKLKQSVGTENDCKAIFNGKFKYQKWQFRRKYHINFKRSNGH